MPQLQFKIAEAVARLVLPTATQPPHTARPALILTDCESMISVEGGRGLLVAAIVGLRRHPKLRMFRWMPYGMHPPAHGVADSGHHGPECSIRASADRLRHGRYVRRPH
jgi:hypothetical protein